MSIARYRKFEFCVPLDIGGVAISVIRAMSRHSVIRAMSRHVFYRQENWLILWSYEQWVACHTSNESPFFDDRRGSNFSCHTSNESPFFSSPRKLTYFFVIRAMSRHFFSCDRRGSNFSRNYHTSDEQCVAVCCSVLQCVAVCCSVLQCVAVFQSKLSYERWVAIFCIANKIDLFFLLIRIVTSNFVFLLRDTNKFEFCVALDIGGVAILMETVTPAMSRHLICTEWRCATLPWALSACLVPQMRKNAGKCKLVSTNCHSFRKSFTAHYSASDESPLDLWRAMRRYLVQVMS